MKLIAKERSVGKRSFISKIRNEGNIPAVMYTKGKEPVQIEVSGADFNAALRQLEKGHLPNTVFELNFENGVKKAIVKDIQYHRTTYDILHLDFYELQEHEAIKVNVPLHFTGVAECQGIKLGGFLRPIKRHIQVKCLPDHIPDAFHLNIKELGLKQAKRVKDITFPENVNCLFGKEEVVVVIGK